MLRGEETVERARTKTAGSTGEDVQLIYPDHKLVIWSELQIWIGARPRRRSIRMLLQLLLVWMAASDRQERLRSRPRTFRL